MSSVIDANVINNAMKDNAMKSDNEKKVSWHKWLTMKNGKTYKCVQECMRGILCVQGFQKIYDDLREAPRSKEVLIERKELENTTKPSWEELVKKTENGIVRTKQNESTSALAVGNRVNNMKTHNEQEEIKYTRSMKNAI